MDDLKQAGPERLTLIERMTHIPHVPYLASALIFPALLAFPLQLVSAYADTLNVEESFERTFTFVSNTRENLPLLTGIVGQSIWFVMLFVFIYMTRYMRQRFLKAEPELAAISLHGEETYHRVFGHISRTGPPLLLWLLFVPSLVDQVTGTIQQGGIFLILWTVVANVISYALFASFIWVYIGSLWGLHKFGKESLRLKSHYDDRMLGVRPIGWLSLSLAMAYFTVAGLGALVLIIAPDLLGSLILSGLVITGIIMFFLPLNSVHKKMVMAKQEEHAAMRDQLMKLANSSEGSESSERLLKRLSDTLTLQMLRQEVSNMPTWPFDTTILGRFAAIILSVTAILLARVITISLHI